MLACRDITEMVTAYLERALPWRRRLAIWMHVQMCGHCRRYLRQVRAVAKATGQVPPLEMPPELEASLARIFESTRPKDES